MSNNQYTLHVATIGVTPTVIGELSNLSIDPGHSVQSGPESSLVEAQFASILQGSPKFSLSTAAVASGLTAIGAGGVALSEAAPLALWFQKRGALGVAAGSVHKKYLANEGIIVPTSLSASAGAFASLGFEATLVNPDGDDACPWAVTSNNAIQAYTFEEEYLTLGAVTVNATTLGLVQSANINFGVQVVPVMQGGPVYPVAASIHKARPSITIQTGDIEFLDTIGPNGLEVTAAVIKLRDCSANGFPAATGITLTVAAGIARVTSQSGGDAADATGTIEITPVKSGSSALIAVGTY